jgi:hypothetical protein
MPGKIWNLQKLQKEFLCLAVEKNLIYAPTQGTAINILLHFILCFSENNILSSAFTYVGRLRTYALPCTIDGRENSFCFFAYSAAISLPFTSVMFCEMEKVSFFSLCCCASMSREKRFPLGDMKRREIKSYTNDDGWFA